MVAISNEPKRNNIQGINPGKLPSKFAEQPRKLSSAGNKKAVTTTPKRVLYFSKVFRKVIKHGEVIAFLRDEMKCSLIESINGVSSTPNTAVTAVVCEVQGVSVGGGEHHVTKLQGIPLQPSQVTICIHI